MARRYEDLSRRGLIQLNNDFDQANDAALLHYLTENDQNYEGIRPVEKAIEGADRLKGAFSGAGKVVKNVLIHQADKVVDKVLGSLAGVLAMEQSDVEIAERAIEEANNGKE